MAWAIKNNVHITINDIASGLRLKKLERYNIKLIAAIVSGSVYSTFFLNMNEMHKDIIIIIAVAIKKLIIRFVSQRYKYYLSQIRSFYV